MKNEEKVKTLEKYLKRTYGQPLYAEYEGKERGAEVLKMKWSSFEVKVQFK